MLLNLNITSQFNKIVIRNLSFRKLKNWYAGLPRRSFPPSPPYNHVIQIGDPTLREKAEPVPQNLIQSTEIKFLIQRLKSVLRKYNCVGLSATQIGIPYKIFAIDLNEKKLREINPNLIQVQKVTVVPFTVFINPEMKIINYNKVKFSEACGSVQGFSADVMRYEDILITAFDENGVEFKLEANGWTARIIQHEMDHLNGNLFTDIMDRSTLSCTCWQVINDQAGNVTLPYHPNL